MTKDKKPFLKYVNGPPAKPKKKKSGWSVSSIKKTPQGTKLKVGIKFSKEW